MVHTITVKKGQSRVDAYKLYQEDLEQKYNFSELKKISNQEFNQLINDKSLIERYKINFTIDLSRFSNLNHMLLEEGYNPYDLSQVNHIESYTAAIWFYKNEIQSAEIFTKEIGFFVSCYLKRVTFFKYKSSILNYLIFDDSKLNNTEFKGLESNSIELKNCEILNSQLDMENFFKLDIKGRIIFCNVLFKNENSKVKASDIKKITFINTKFENCSGENIKNFQNEAEKQVGLRKLLLLCIKEKKLGNNPLNLLTSLPLEILAEIYSKIFDLNVKDISPVFQKISKLSFQDIITKERADNQNQLEIGK